MKKVKVILSIFVAIMCSLTMVGCFGTKDEDLEWEMTTTTYAQLAQYLEDTSVVSSLDSYYIRFKQMQGDKIEVFTAIINKKDDFYAAKIDYKNYENGSETDSGTVFVGRDLPDGLCLAYYKTEDSEGNEVKVKIDLTDSDCFKVKNAMEAGGETAPVISMYESQVRVFASILDVFENFVKYIKITELNFLADPMGEEIVKEGKKGNDVKFDVSFNYTYNEEQVQSKTTAEYENKKIKTYKVKETRLIEDETMIYEFEYSKYNGTLEDPTDLDEYVEI